MPRRKKNKEILEPKNPLVKVGAINFNVIGYGNPTIKHKRIMDSFCEYSYLSDGLKDMPFPKNDSVESMKEMKFIKEQSRQMENEETLKECLLIDKDLKKYMSAVCKKLDIQGFEYFYDQLNDRLLKYTITDLKYFYNRMRPYQLSWYFVDESDITPIESCTSNSPSYPSGHTLQGLLVSKVLSKHFPQHKDIFNKMAMRIAMSRIIVGVHYPSDNSFSEKVCSHIMNDEKFNNEFINEKWEFLTQERT